MYSIDSGLEYVNLLLVCTGTLGLKSMNYDPIMMIKSLKLITDRLTGPNSSNLFTESKFGDFKCLWF